MSRPQSFEFCNNYKISPVRRSGFFRSSHREPRTISKPPVVPEFSGRRHPFADVSSDNMRPPMQRQRKPDIDRQYCKIIRNYPAAAPHVPHQRGISSSQSFSQQMATYAAVQFDPYRVPVDNAQQHMSRLMTSLYMSPPPNDWMTVGNVMKVKRSTSMPGTRGVAISADLHRPPRMDKLDEASPVKKKHGPFHCLKHQIKRSNVRPDVIQCRATPVKELVLPRSPAVSLPLSVTTDCISQLKESKSFFFKKKDPKLSSQPTPSVFTKPRGIKKSISLLFSSKSVRTSKSDPSNLDQMKFSTNCYPGSQNQSEKVTIKSVSSRMNLSYESMLSSDDSESSSIPMSETDKFDCYRSVCNSSSAKKTNPVASTDNIIRYRSPSESSYSESVCSSEKQVYMQNTANHFICDQQSINSSNFHGNTCFLAAENSWKTIVGNVCRSNSKDSAIANSTVSNDGILTPSKRISLVSNNSRISDLTNASDFNDSSYSSFNDLQPNPSLSFNAGARSKVYQRPSESLKPETIETKQASSSDNSPSSKSSTETLKPLSCLLRRRNLSTNKDNRPFRSNTLSKQQQFSTSVESIRFACLRRIGSWPKCVQKYSFKRNPYSSPIRVIRSRSTHSKHHPKSFVCNNNNKQFLKLDYSEKVRSNNSPLLSQYSRLYSLKSPNFQATDLSFFSGHHGSSTHSPVTNFKYSYQFQK